MATVYSTLLFSSVAVPAGTYYSDPVPAGHVWVVRDIDVGNVIGDNLDNSGWTLTDFANCFIAQQLVPWVRASGDYHKSTRQVMTPGDKLVMNTFDPDWSWRISGFLLTLP